MAHFAQHKWHSSHEETRSPKAYSAVAVHQNEKRVTLSVQRVDITLLDGELALGSHLVVMVEEKK